MRRNYIGLACTPHDPAIAIVGDNGVVRFAEATERQLQSKRAWNAVPDDLNYMERVLREHCDPDAEWVLAKTWSSAEFYPWWARLLYDLSSRRKLNRREQYNRRLFLTMEAGVEKNLRHAGDSIALHAAQGLSRFPVVDRRYDHHLCHAATACFTSPFDEAVCVVLDGFGERSSTSFFRYESGKLTRLDYGTSLGSLGGFYWDLCSMCGFDPVKGEEWKVMGLAPYGKRDDELYRLVRPMLEVKGLRVHWARDLKSRQDRLFERRDPDADPMCAANLAHATQEVFGEVVEELLRNLHAKGISDHLVLGGGCALNSAFNGQILGRTPFRELHVYSAPADDGNALGAAQLAYFEDHPDRVPSPEIASPYLGSRVNRDALERIGHFGNMDRFRTDADSVTERAAELLSEGKIVGWVQGRAEFGPRALGNRSILADPRGADVKERINAKVKFREGFRPFAPSILHEFGPEYFDDYQESPYMERTLRFRDEVRERVPGVVHADGTGRLQTVKHEWNARYHDLLSAFHRRTGIPVLVNTSFNVMGKPIIHSVEDALAVFFTTGLDALVVEDEIFEK